MDLKYLSEHYEDKLVQGVAGRIRDLIATQGKANQLWNQDVVFELKSSFLFVDISFSI